MEATITTNMPLATEEGPAELGYFSPGDLGDPSYWASIGLLEPPKFLRPLNALPDSVLVGSDQRFLILLRQELNHAEQRFLVEHCRGHIELGHIRLGDNVAHWDVAATLRNGHKLSRWDAQVAEYTGTPAAGVTRAAEEFQTLGLSEVFARLTANEIDLSWLSAALLYKSYREEMVEIPRLLRERAQLFPHQARGIAELIARMRRFNTALLADSVGLGKTRTTCAVIRTLIDQQSLARAGILAPRKLERNWRKEFAVVGLQEGRDVVLVNKDVFKRLSPQQALVTLKGFGLIVVEEAHQDLRNPGNRFHRNLRDAAGLAHGLLLTATPWNNRRGDIFAILSPFVRPLPGTADGVFECFKKGFRTGRKEFEESDETFNQVYSLTVLQRTRRQLREMGDAGVYYAPREPKLDVVPYKRSEQAAFRALLGVVEAIKLPYFNPVRYLTAESDAEWRLSGTHRFFLLKRAESSMAAFRLTLHGMRERAAALREQLSAVEDSEDSVARWLASYYHISEEVVENALDSMREGTLIEELITRPRQRRALRLITEAKAKGRLRPLRRKLIRDSESDIRLLDKVEAKFALLFRTDPKIASVVAVVRAIVASGQKALLISQFADTAFTVYKTLINDKGIAGAGIGLVMSTAKGKEAPIQANGKPAKREAVIRLFAPRAWALSEIETGRAAHGLLSGEKELSVLVGTDTLSVGQNLQDARVILHLDLTWNPMVLEQRIGRLDRPRHESDDEPIHIRYFLNLDLIEAELQLKKTIDARLEATYRDTAFDDEILPGYFELIETMRKLRAARADAGEIAHEVDALLEELATARPPDLKDSGVESRREALNKLRDNIGEMGLSEPLPQMALTLGRSPNDQADLVAEIELQAYDNNEARIGHPSRRLITLRQSSDAFVTALDDLPQAVNAVLSPAEEVAIPGVDSLPLLRAFDQEVQRIAGEIRDERNRLREKRRQIRERTRPSWLTPTIQSVKSFLERLPDAQYEAFLTRYSITDEALGNWLDALASGVDLDSREMAERLRKLEANPSAISDEFGDLRELVIEAEARSGEDGAPQQLVLDLEPYVHRIEARVTNIRINLPPAA